MDDVLSSERCAKMILNHFVKGRLYDRDLKSGEVFETVGGQQLKITKDLSGHVSVNQAKVVESEIFVYNLGTMYYIDDILYPEVLQKNFKPITQAPKEREESESSEESFTTEMPIFEDDDEKLTTKPNREPTTSEYRSVLQALLTTRSDVEFVPSQFTEFSDDVEDFSSSDIYVTPKALPLRSVASPPRK